MGVGVVVTLCIKVTNIWSRTGRQSIRHPPKPLYKCISHSWRAFYVSCTIPKIISCLLLTFPSNLLSNDANGSHLYIFLKIIYWLGLHTTGHFLIPIWSFLARKWLPLGYIGTTFEYSMGFWQRDNTGYLVNGNIYKRPPFPPQLHPHLSLVPYMYLHCVNNPR